MYNSFQFAVASATVTQQMNFFFKAFLTGLMENLWGNVTLIIKYTGQLTYTNEIKKPSGFLVQDGFVFIYERVKYGSITFAQSNLKQGTTYAKAGQYFLVLAANGNSFRDEMNVVMMLQVGSNQYMFLCEALVDENIYSPTPILICSNARDSMRFFNYEQTETIKKLYNFK